MIVTEQEEQAKEAIELLSSEIQPPDVSFIRGAVRRRQQRRKGIRYAAAMGIVVVAIVGGLSAAGQFDDRGQEIVTAQPAQGDTGNDETTTSLAAVPTTVSSSSSISETTSTVPTTTNAPTTVPATTIVPTTVAAGDAPLFRGIVGTLPRADGVILRSVLDLQSVGPIPGVPVSCASDQIVSIWAWTDADSVRVLATVPGESVRNVTTGASGEVAVLSLCGTSMVVSIGEWVEDDLRIVRSFPVDSPGDSSLVSWRGEELVVIGRDSALVVDTVTGSALEAPLFELRFPGMDTFAIELIPFAVDSYCEGEPLAPGLAAVDSASSDETYWTDPGGGFQNTFGRVTGRFGEPWFSLAANGHFAYLATSCGESVSAFAGTVDPNTGALVAFEQIPIPHSFGAVPNTEISGPDVIYARDDGSIATFVATGSGILRFEWAAG